MRLGLLDREFDLVALKICEGSTPRMQLKDYMDTVLLRVIRSASGLSSAAYDGLGEIRHENSEPVSNDELAAIFGAIADMWGSLAVLMQALNIDEDSFRSAMLAQCDLYFKSERRTTNE